MIHYITTNGIGNAWVAAELKVIEGKGIPFKLHSMRAPHQNFFGSEWYDRLNKETNLIYPLPAIGFIISLLLAPFLFRTRFFETMFNALFSKRESPRVRMASIAHFLVACHWARSIRHEKIALIHSQWAQSGATIGMYGAWLLEAPFSFTGHAVDLFRERAALHDKIKRANFIVCISNFHRDFYLKNGARQEQLFINYCGIDVELFAFRPKCEMKDPPHIISIGRLIEKKGFEYLIDACELLRERGLELRCTIAGDGPLTEPLCNRVKEKNLEGAVEVTGKQVLQEDMADFMYSGDIFAQPCVWSSDNDVDGTPRTLMEAMACGLPSISTRLAGIPDIIEDGKSGLLVDPNDTEQLADAIELLITDSKLAEKLSRGGRLHIEEKFKLPECVEPLQNKFQRILDGNN